MGKMWGTIRERRISVKMRKIMKMAMSDSKIKGLGDGNYGMEERERYVCRDEYKEGSFLP